LVVWKIFGDPFESLVNLCKTSNISFFMQSLYLHGYYVNGNGNADEAAPSGLEKTTN
jgi:hypothetical protein